MVVRFLILLFALIPVFSFSQRDWTVPFKSEQAFLQNLGQFDEVLPTAQILYGIDHGFGWQVMMDKQGAYLISRKFNRGPKGHRMDGRGTTESTIVRQEWVGANPNVTVTPLQLRPDYFSYSYQVSGNFFNLDHVNGYTKLLYANLYPGIHLEYESPEEGGIKYTLRLDAGADPSLAKIRYSGATPVLGSDGNIEIPTVLGTLKDMAPSARYADGQYEAIPCDFTLNGNEVGFSLGTYNPARPVIIDPWTVNPAFPLFNRAFDVDADAAGNVYAWGGGMGYNLKKYNSAGVLQWTHVSPWDTSNAWFGELLVMPAGDVFISAGSAAKLRRLTTAGATVFTNNGPFLNMDEYWNMTLNCDNTKLLIGGSRIISLTSPQGHIFNVNMSTGAQLAGSPVNIAPTGMNEVRGLNRSAVNGRLYALTNNNLVALDNNLGVVFNIANGYSLPYYSPAYMANSVQGVNAVDANATALYTSNGASVDRRDPNTGAILGTVAIPGGGFTGGFFGTGATNSGVALDGCGNLFVGSSNQVLKYNSTLVQQATVATTGAVYDVVVAPANTVIWGGNGFVTSNTSLAACPPQTYSCVVLPIEIGHFEAICEENTAYLNWSLTKPANGYSLTLEHSPNGHQWEKKADVPMEADLDWSIQLSQPNWFYRVAFRDAQGTVQYSPVANLPGCNVIPASMEVIPNVCNSQTNLVLQTPLEGSYMIELVDVTGKSAKRMNREVHQENVLPINMEDLESGMYLIRLHDLATGKIETGKVIKR